MLLLNRHITDRFCDDSQQIYQGQKMIIGYARVSKADGSQTTDLQRDALLAEGVQEERIYEDHVSRKMTDQDFTIV